MRTLLMVASVAALAVAAEQTAFEVVSIRRTPPNTRSSNSILPGGRYTAIGTTLKWLIVAAFDLAPHQLEGANGWMENEEYDVVAKAPEGLIKGSVGRDASWSGPGGARSNWTAADPNSENSRKMREMLQAMLADRFQLKFHREMKEFSVYAMVPAKGGPKVAESPSSTLQLQWSMGHLTYKGAPMSMLAMTLTRITGRPVVDQTGLKGNYDYTLAWTPDATQMQMFRGADGSPAQPPDTAAPSIFTVLQEQLGLKLEPTKAPIEVFVVDHAERPSEN